MVVDSRIVFKIMKVICCLMPIFCLGYFMTFAGSMSFSAIDSGILEQQPALAVVLLISMLCPYIAYILNVTENDLLDSKFEYAMMNIIILFAAALLMKNIVLCIGFSLGIHSLLKDKSMRFNQLVGMIKQVKLAEGLKETGGSLIVLALSSICLFAMLRLGI